MDKYFLDQLSLQGAAKEVSAMSYQRMVELGITPEDVEHSVSVLRSSELHPAGTRDRIAALEAERGKSERLTIRVQAFAEMAYNLIKVPTPQGRDLQDFLNALASCMTDQEISGDFSRPDAAVSGDPASFRPVADVQGGALDPLSAAELNATEEIREKAQEIAARLGLPGRVDDLLRFSEKLSAEDAATVWALADSFPDMRAEDLIEAARGEGQGDE